MRLYLGKSPQEEINRLADDEDVWRKELQAAVREYMASLEAPAKPTRTLRFLKLPKLPWAPFHRLEDADTKYLPMVGVTVEMPVQHSAQGETGPGLPP